MSTVVAGRSPMGRMLPRKPRFMAVATVVSCIPDAVYPWDPAVVKAIQEFDRDVIPVSVRKVYVAPDTKGFRFVTLHGIAKHVPAINRHGPPQESLQGCLMPTVGGPRFRPTQMELYIADRGKGTFGWGYRPFDWHVYQLLRSLYDEWSWSERKAYIDEHGPEAQAAKEKAAAQAEIDYAYKTDGPWLKRQIEQFDDDDKKRVAARDAGLIKHEAKPFVEVHAKEKTA